MNLIKILHMRMGRPKTSDEGVEDINLALVASGNHFTATVC
jgi:hypothetical protein